MKWMTRGAALALATLLGVFGAGCGDDGTTPEMDGGIDAGPPTRIEDVPLDEEVVQAGLAGNVEAVRDTTGLWHIYGENLEDIVRAQGYLQARDRIGQMDFFRRTTSGRLSELLGTFAADLVVPLDEAARFQGHLRNAAAIEATLDDETRGLLQAFADGVNQRIQELKDGDAEMPRGVATLYPVDIAPEVLPEWTVIDTLAISRYLSATLSFTASDDLERGAGLAGWLENYPADAEDPRHAQLHGLFHDLYSFRPARRVAHLGVGDEAPGALLPPRPRVLPDRFDPTPFDRDQLQATLSFTRQLDRHLSQFGSSARGSNSWVVSGDHTASGNAILANDPHLLLSGPSLFWQAHINTKRAGGDINVGGQMLAGTHVNILGWNDEFAWGLTTSNYDVSDVYLEHITVVEGGPDTVEFNGEQVAIETVTEVLRFDNGTTRDLVFERVPHHGLIVPGSRTSVGEGQETAYSIRWTGNEPTVELNAFFDLYTASNEEQVRAAWSQFEVGNQTLVAAFKEGNILYISDVDVPVRDARALDYDPTTYEGTSPCTILDGRGDHEWTDRLSSNVIPQASNPERGFVATANADADGQTFDNNPFDAEHYLSCSFWPGHRIARITERLEEIVARGDVTPEDLADIQNDAQSAFGRFHTPVWLEEIDRALAELDSPGTHADLSAALEGADRAALQRARDRLAAWSFETPAAIEGSPTAEEVADSIATTIFNVALTRMVRIVFDDELDYGNDGEFNGNPIRRIDRNGIEQALFLAFAAPEELYGYDAEADTLVYFDDIQTEAVETRGDRVVRAILQGDAWLQEHLGTNDAEWLWGKLHTLRLDGLIPIAALGASDPLSIPSREDGMFPLGFPRHGDRGAVDASTFTVYAENYDPSNDVNDFRYDDGPQQRLVVEMTPDGPVVRNALPGGNAEDPDSPYFSNQMELWRRNETAPVAWSEEQVLEIATEHIRFVPES